jgi:glutamyl-Q tRNA(Asp) synthetase
MPTQTILCALSHFSFVLKRDRRFNAPLHNTELSLTLPQRSFGTELAHRLETRVTGSWVTRFAPAPTGWLHLGHAVNAVFVWGLARALGGRVALRIEDHDRGRCRLEYELGVLDDLDWLGLEPDIASTQDFRLGVSQWRQSDRLDVYEQAMNELGGVYACMCSRRDIAEASSDGTTAETRYPGTCRTRGIPLSETLSRRVRIDPGTEVFDDVALGPQSQDPDRQCGDVLIRDRSGNWTYQFAVVVDDLQQQIDVVIRGEDLLASTGRQIRMARLLGRPQAPVFLHHPLILRADGSKLSKSDGATGLRDLRAAGWPAERVLGEAARLAGLSVRGTIAARELAELFT